MYKSPMRGTIEVQISSKVVTAYLREIGFDPKNRLIPEWIHSDQSFSNAAVRGLFDTEGTVGHKKTIGRRGNYLYKQLTVTNTNKNILGFVERVLVGQGYKPTLGSRKNIYISNSLDISRYLNDIGIQNCLL
jgi:hypothetical protein